MLLLAGLACGLSAIGWAYGLYEKPLREQLFREMLGDKTFECSKSQGVRMEAAQRKAFAESGKMRIMERQLNIASAALAIVTLGALYLWSCLVVRVVGEKTKKSLNPTAPPQADSRHS